MRLLIAVPSKGRADSIFRRTLRWTPRLGYDVKVFVEPQEIEQYREGARDANYQNRLAINDDMFIDIGKNDGGLSYAKGFIKNYATQHNYELVFKMDDDVLRFTGRGKNKPDDQMIIEFSEMVGICRVTFGKYPDVAAIGFPYRHELFEPKKWSLINGRLQSCYIIRTEYIQTGFNTFEDFAQYVYIRSLNKVTLRYGLLGIDAADVGKNRGGHQMFDRNQQSVVEAKELKKIYPGLIFKQVKDKAWAFEPVLAGAFFGIKKL